MSQKHTSNRDRLSPRRRFHRPAAEFLGARRQVPVLTGLPRIGDDRTEEQEEAIASASAPREPDIVERVLDTATEEPTVNIREASTHLSEVSDPWREWAFPMCGILIAGLLCYTAWLGLNNPMTSTTNPTKRMAEEAPTVEFEPVQVAEAPPVDSVSLAPADGSADGGSIEEARSFDNVSMAPVDSFSVEQSAPKGPTFAEPVVQAPVMLAPERFLQQPFQEPQKSTEFVQHEVLDWNQAATSVASKPDPQPLSRPSIPETTDDDIELELASEPNEIHDALPMLSPESADELESDLDYPSTGYAEDFPSQASVSPDGGIDLADLSPPQLPETDLGDMSSPPAISAPVMPTTPNTVGHYAPASVPQLDSVASPFTNAPQSPHVVVNPHFQPTQTPNTNNFGGAAFETARAMPIQPQSPTLGTAQPTHPNVATQRASASVTNKSIYGSFPNVGTAGAQSSLPSSVEQARLNGSIEPFPQSN